MTIEERTANARKQLAQAEEMTLHAIASAKTVISEQEEELRQAKLEAAQRNDDILTEEEFAGIFKVSAVTIAKLRKAGLLEPIWIGSLPRYSRTLHVAKATEIFAKRKPRGGRGRRSE